MRCIPGTKKTSPVTNGEFKRLFFPFNEISLKYILYYIHREMMINDDDETCIGIGWWVCWLRLTVPKFRSEWKSDAEFSDCLRGLLRFALVCVLWFALLCFAALCFPQMVMVMLRAGDYALNTTTNTTVIGFIHTDRHTWLLYCAYEYIPRYVSLYLCIYLSVCLSISLSIFTVCTIPTSEAALRPYIRRSDMTRIRYVQYSDILSYHPDQRLLLLQSYRLYRDAFLFFF